MCHHWNFCSDLLAAPVYKCSRHVCRSRNRMCTTATSGSIPPTSIQPTYTALSSQLLCTIASSDWTANIYMQYHHQHIHPCMHQSTRVIPTHDNVNDAMYLIQYCTAIICIHLYAYWQCSAVLASYSMLFVKHVINACGAFSWQIMTTRVSPWNIHIQERYSFCSA